MIKSLAVVLFLVLSTATAYAETTQETNYDRIVRTGVLRCGYFVWPPFMSKDANTGKLGGISHDVMENVGSILGLKIEWTSEVGVADYIEGLQTNRFDALCVSSWPHPTRFKESLATTPLFYTSVFPVVRENNTQLNKNYNAISKGLLKIGVIEGDDTEAMVNRLYPNTPRETLPNNADYTQLIVALLSKRTDVIFLDKSVIHDFIKNNGNKIKIPKADDPVSVYPEYLFVKRGDIQTKLLLDTAIQIVRDRGDMNAFLSHFITSSTVNPPASK